MGILNGCVYEVTDGHEKIGHGSIQSEHRPEARPLKWKKKTISKEGRRGAQLFEDSLSPPIENAIASHKSLKQVGRSKRTMTFK